MCNLSAVEELVDSTVLLRIEIACEHKRQLLQSPHMSVPIQGHVRTHTLKEAVCELIWPASRQLPSTHPPTHPPTYLAGHCELLQLLHQCHHLHTSAYFSIRQHTSTYMSAWRCTVKLCGSFTNVITCHIDIWNALILIIVRRHTSAYVSIRQHTSAYDSTCHILTLGKP